MSRFEKQRDNERYFEAILRRNGISKRDSERLLGRYREAGSTRDVQAFWTDGKIELKDGANAAFFGPDDYRRGSATINGHRFQWDRSAGLLPAIR